MALATKCPHCHTVFRVALDQLKLRGGIVRCGACNEIFDGNAALVEPSPRAVAVPVPVAAPAAGAALDLELALDDEDAGGTPPDAAPGPGPDAAPEREPFAAPAAAAAEQDTDAPAVRDEPPAVLDERIEPGFDIPSEHIVAVALDDLHHFDEAPGYDEQPGHGEEPGRDERPGHGAEAEPDEAPGHDQAPGLDEAPGYAQAPGLDEAPGYDVEPGHDAAPGQDEEPSGADEPPRDDAPRPQAADAVPAGPDAGQVASDAADRAADDAAAADLLTAAPDSALLAAGTGRLLRRSAKARPGARRGRIEPSVDGATVDEPAPAPGIGQFATAPAPVPGIVGRAATSPASDAAPPDDSEEPGFVRRANRRERAGRAARLALIAGVPLLAFLLLAQGVLTLRNRLAADHPDLKPALQALCAPLGCTVELPRQIDALAVEQGELQTLAPRTFSYVTVLRNQSRSVQAWPHLELVLKDAADKAVLRRVFAPRDYLAAGGEPAADAAAALARGFGPRSEQAVKLYFVLDVEASGYRIAIFYP